MISNELLLVIISLSILLFLSYTLHISFILLVLVFYVVCVIYFSIRVKIHSTKEYEKYKRTTTSAIPTIVYTYWHSEQLPHTVQKCITSWKRHLKGYTIHVINEKNIKKYSSSYVTWKPSFTHQQRADLLRLEVLQHTGGIWMDATIYLNDSLDWVHSYQHAEKSEYVGFKLNGFQRTSTPVVENWFMASVPHSAFIRDWKDEFSNIIHYSSTSDFVESLRNKKVDFQGVEDPYYLTMHISCLAILKHNNTYSLSLLTAEDGPYKYLSSCCMTSVFFPFVFLLFQGQEAPIVKYRGIERTILEYSSMFHLLK